MQLIITYENGEVKVEVTDHNPRDGGDLVWSLMDTDSELWNVILKQMSIKYPKIYKRLKHRAYNESSIIPPDRVFKNE